MKVDECIITIRLLLLNRIICLIEIEEIIIKIEAYKVVCLDHKFYKFSENLLSEFLKISVSALKKKFLEHILLSNPFLHGMKRIHLIFQN